MAYLVASQTGLDIIGPPRLVRLNPNIRQKTRGNAALCLRLGHGSGTPTLVGECRGEPIRAYPRGEEPTAAEASREFEHAAALINGVARHTPGKGAGLVASARSPSESIYEAMVHRFVGAHEVLQALAPCEARFQGWGDGRGVRGAAAAAAWPGRQGTFEWIAYRQPSRIGTPRRIDFDVGRVLDASFPTTFDNVDRRHKRLRIVPQTPCPVLAGVRGIEPSQLIEAGRTIGPERPEGWLLFATNQATNDHVRPVGADDLRPFTNARVTVTVSRKPETLPGGHVWVRAHAGSVELDLVAFEPTKDFRDAVRELRAGETVQAYGGTHEDPSVLALERVDLLASPPVKAHRSPTCVCGRRMENRGRSEGYRCPSCRQTTALADVSQGEGRPVGSWEVPVCARRHLARPVALRELATEGLVT